MRRAEGDARGQHIPRGPRLRVSVHHVIEVGVARSVTQRIEPSPPQGGTAQHGAEDRRVQLAQQSQDRLNGPGQAGVNRGADERIILGASFVKGPTRRAYSEEDRREQIGEAAVRVTLALERGTVDEKGQIGQGGETQGGPGKPARTV